MQRWEYSQLVVTLGGPVSETTCEWTLFKTDDSHPPESGEVGPMFAKLGKGGWELAAASARVEAGLNNKHVTTYVFKRPATQ